MQDITAGAFHLLLLCFPAPHRSPFQVQAILKNTFLRDNIQQVKYFRAEHTKKIHRKYFNAYKWISMYFQDCINSHDFSWPRITFLKFPLLWLWEAICLLVSIFKALRDSPWPERPEQRWKTQRFICLESIILAAVLIHTKHSRAQNSFVQKCVCVCVWVTLCVI